MVYIIKQISRSFSAAPAFKILSIAVCSLALVQIYLGIYAIEFTRSSPGLTTSETCIMAYLLDSPTKDELSSIREEIESLEGVKGATFIPRSKGLERMKTWLGNDNSIIAGIDHSILPDAMEISLFSMKHSGATTRYLAAHGKIGEFRMVRSRFPELVGLGCVVQAGARISGAIMTTCIFIAIFLCIRSEFISRKDETEVLRLIGAPALMVYLPFLAEALLTAAISSAIAACTVNIWLYHAGRSIPELGVVSPDIKTILLVTALACLASSTGALLALKESRHA